MKIKKQVEKSPYILIIKSSIFFVRERRSQKIFSYDKTRVENINQADKLKKAILNFFFLHHALLSPNNLEVVSQTVWHSPNYF